MYKRLIFFTSFPPPVTGQTNVSNYLFAVLSEVIECVKVDTARYGGRKRTIATGILRVIYLFNRLIALKSIILRDETIVYFVVSSSRIGAFRDIVYLFFFKLFGGSVLAHIHAGNYHQVGGFLFGIPGYLIATLVDKFIFLSESLSAKSMHIPSDKIVVIPNTLPSSFMPSPNSMLAAASTRSIDEPLKILFLSNLIESKGFLDLIRACAYVADNGFPVTVQLAGRNLWASSDKDVELELRKIAPNVSISYEGVANETAVKRLLKSNHLLALPSFYPIEAQPRCILEAIAWGLPVIATPRGAIRDLVINDYNGMLVREQCVPELTEAILTYGDDTKRLRHGRNARKHFSDHYSEKIVRQSLVDLVTGFGS